MSALDRRFLLTFALSSPAFANPRRAKVLKGRDLKPKKKDKKRLTNKVNTDKISWNGSENVERSKKTKKTKLKGKGETIKNRPKIKQNCEGQAHTHERVR